jgi:hypothetical protein
VWDDQIGHVFLDGVLKLMDVAVVGFELSLLLMAHGLLLWSFRVAKLGSSRTRTHRRELPVLPHSCSATNKF